MQKNMAGQVSEVSVLISKMIMLFGVGILGLTLLSCSKKKEDDAAPAAPAEKEGVFYYAIQDETCNSGRHTFFKLSEFCENLMLDVNNGNCSRNTRKRVFDSRCEGHVWNPDAAYQKLYSGKEMRVTCSLTEGKTWQERELNRITQISKTKRFEMRTANAMMSVNIADYNSGNVGEIRVSIQRIDNTKQFMGTAVGPSVESNRTYLATNTQFEPVTLQTEEGTVFGTCSPTFGSN